MSGDEDKPEPSPGDDRADDQEKIIARRRHRLARRVRSGGSRWSEGQVWVFVVLALVFLAAWLLGRDACSRKFGEAFNDVTGSRSKKDASVTRVPDAADDGW